MNWISAHNFFIDFFLQWWHNRSKLLLKIPHVWIYPSLPKSAQFCKRPNWMLFTKSRTVQLSEQNGQSFRLVQPKSVQRRAFEPKPAEFDLQWDPFSMPRKLLDSMDWGWIRRTLFYQIMLFQQSQKSEWTGPLETSY